MCKDTKHKGLIVLPIQEATEGNEYPGQTPPYTPNTKKQNKAKVQKNESCTITCSLPSPLHTILFPAYR